jgi:hypothetical protein
MARLRRDARLESREARSRLPLSEDNTAYWRTIESKLAIGYYKGSRGETWYVRSRKGNRYIKAGERDKSMNALGTDMSVLHTVAVL